MNTRNGTLSPTSTADSREDWSPITRYQNITGENPYSPTLPPDLRGITPPASVHTSTSTNITDGGMSNGMSSRSGASNGNPSPPSSVGRSSDGTGLYAANMQDANLSSRKMQMLEETLSEHYRVLRTYLGPYLRDEKGNPRPSRAKDKLTRLSAVQFQELSTDVYDESIRREADRKRGGPGAPGNDVPKFLLPKNNFHPKRNQARQKLSTLPLERFRQLATDVFYELERRFPRFTGPGGPQHSRMGSAATSIASRGSRGPPSRVGTPNSMGGGRGRPPGPPPPGFRGGPPGPPGPGGPGGPGFRPGSAGNEFGRPLPKTFQQNTIVPNKGTMVEDDDDDSGANDEDDDADAFDLEGAAPRQSRRQTNKSMKSINVAQEKLVADLESQVSQLQNKAESLENKLQEKDGELLRLRDADRNRDTTAATERAEWDDLRYSLEQKVEQAENLNTSLRTEIEKIQAENSDAERDLRDQISELQVNARQQQESDDGGEWRARCEQLERELMEQQQVTEEVRREATNFLQEMRELSSRSNEASEKEEQLSNQVSALEADLKEWKSRYARTKTQLRNLKASSVGLASLASPDITNYSRDASFTTPDGLVKDVHVTKFQLSIDELLQVARRADPEQVLESMKHVVKCVRAITGDIDQTPLSQLQSPSSSVNGDGIMSPEKQQGKLKARVSATANNLITASKNHASSAGLSPVSLLDAAASHLSTSIIELVKYVKVRPTPGDELEADEEDDRPMPLKPNTYSAYNPYTPNTVNDNGHTRHRSRGGSSESTTYSNLSSPYGGYGRSSLGMNGTGPENDAELTEFKNYLEDQSSLLVQSISPLVNLIRSSPDPSADDEQQMFDYIQDIAQAVQDTGARTDEAVKNISNPALRKHAVPIVEVLEDSSQSLLQMDIRDGGRDKIPPLAFKTARAMKELILRVERIESGELTADQALKDDF